MKQLFVYLVGLAALAVCAILLPELTREAVAENPDFESWRFIFLGSAYIMSIPFFAALYQTLKLLNYIDENKAFSDLSVKALQNIITCILAFNVLVVAGAVARIGAIRSILPNEDVTAVVALALILILASSVIATFVSVLQRLLQDAIAMQKENELTV